MNQAMHPFEFKAVSYLTRIGNWKAATLKELLDGLDQCSDASVFHHTFHTLHAHHFLTVGFSNDFAQWVLAALNRPGLAEQLAALDIRDYVSIPELRRDLRRLVADDCAENPSLAGQQGLEEFYFCESVEITVPLGIKSCTLAEFRQGLSALGHASLYYHFISSRLHTHLNMNDFSYWLEENLGLGALASRASGIDIYTNTLDSVKEQLLALLDQEMSA
jgi:hypothetical protein